MTPKCISALGKLLMGSVPMRTLLLLTALALLLPSSPAMGQDTPAKEIITPSFAAFAIETELQRELIGRPEANIYLELDATPVVETGRATPDNTLTPEVKERLRELIHDHNIKSPQVTVWLAGPLPPSIRPMSEQMKTIFAESTFEPKLKLDSTYFTSTPVLSSQEPPPFLAPGTDNKSVDRLFAGEGFTAFAVTSDLARHKAGGADVYVTLHQPITRDFKAFPPNLVSRMKEAIDQLEPANRRRVIVRCLATRDGEKLLESLTRHGVYGRPLYPTGPTIADQLAQDLGLQMCGISIYGLGFSPEDLIHRRAHNFQLSNQDGEMVDFHAKTKGKVTVLNFSGIACAPCQKEAPHLTALQKEFADQNVKVISVNGYNESLEEIQQNMKRLSLEHETLVMGQSVAKGQYTVTSYPLTFFLDDKGIIRDFHLGFEKGDEALLKEKIAKLLSKEED